MRIAVIGAGVIGVTTAFELTRDGHEVSVFERCSTAAEGASFANAGLIAAPWMAALASMEWKRQQKSGVRSWWGGLRRNRKPPVSDPGPAVLALAQAGASRLDRICGDLQLTVESHQGLMAVWKTQAMAEVAQELFVKVRDFGGECHLLPSEQARALELALNSDTQLLGAMVMPDAWTVNCRQFSLLLKARAQEMGCRFEFGQAVTDLQVDQHVRLSGGSALSNGNSFDHVVLCAGATSESLLRTLGVQLPLEMGIGYSLSSTVREAIDAPVAVVHDLQHGVSVARLAQRVRISSQRSDPDGGDRTDRAFQLLYKVLDDWFPGAIRLGKNAVVQEWSSQVTSTADGLPVIGETAAPRVWINTGHGMNGWVMACAAARMLADLMERRETEVIAAPYSPRRWAV